MRSSALLGQEDSVYLATDLRASPVSDLGPQEDLTMEYRVLGRTGVRVSSLALGTANFADPTPEEESARILERAVDAGINLIDTGDSYAKGESERIIGRALKRCGLRDQVLISTKVFPPTGPGPNERGSSRLHVMRACEESLRRLQTDYIDIYFVHRLDPDTHQEETLGALNDLVRSGMVRYVACSTHPAWRVMEALAISDRRGYARYCCEQPPYNLLDRRIENELIPLCQEHGLGLLPWSPIAQGVLAGRYSHEAEFPEGSRASYRGGIYAERINRAGIEVGDRFVTLAQEAGISPIQLAVLWVKDQPGVTAPVIGPRTSSHLEDYLPVAQMQLSEELRARCDGLVPPGGMVANFHNSAGWGAQSRTLGVADRG
jgi:aryl-alcohol dehydrogenase-like predicted oxidoreductase